jgi:hypothetical protein
MEPKSDLSSIFTSQVTYFGEEDTYASSLQALGWVPEDGARYTYTMVEASATHFLARAEGNIDKDPTIDVWVINEERELKNTVNDRLPEKSRKAVPAEDVETPE